MTPAATYRAVFEGWLKRFNIRVQWLRDFPDPIGPTSNWKRRRVTLHPFSVGDADERLAESAHEVGHILGGTCPNQPPHQRRQMVTLVACVCCEVTATRVGEWLVRRAGLPWTRTMHDRLSRALHSYGRTTPAPAAALQALNVLASDGRYATRMQERLRREIQIAEIQAIAASPRYVAREEKERQMRLRKHAEIQQLVRGM